MFTTVILAGCNSSGTATANNPQVEDRAKLMKDWRHANEGMKAMIEDPSRFDAITFKERADFIADTNATMWVHFEGRNGSRRSCLKMRYGQTLKAFKPKSKRLPAQLMHLP